MGNRSARCSYVCVARSEPYCFDGIYREVETAHIVQNTFITPASPIVYGFIQSMPIYTRKPFYCERIYAERNCEKWIGMNNCIWWLGVEYVTCAHTALVRYKCAILPFIFAPTFSAQSIAG